MPPSRSLVTFLCALACAAISALSLLACKGAKSNANPNDVAFGGPGPGEGAPLPEGGVFRRADLLRAFGECSLTNARAFVPLAEELARATKAASDTPTAETLAAAREAWNRAIDHWQRLEVMQYGPSGPTSRPGGLEMRESIYSWPLGGRCLVEQILSSKGYEAPTFNAGLVNTRGLLALEYLLFYEAADNACAPTASINATNAWASLGAEEIAKRKRAYAHAAANDLVTRARELANTWEPTGGNFVAEMSSAGQGSKVFATDQAAFNSVSDALFYVEFEVKDMKVARPAGLLDCATGTCPEAIESLYAKRSKVHIRNNLLGTKMLISGCDGPAALGFDDLLRAVGQGALADDLVRLADAAVVAVDAIEETELDAALVSDLPSVRALHEAIKRLTDRLKTDFVSILDLEIPKKIEGDND